MPAFTSKAIVLACALATGCGAGTSATTGAGATDETREAVTDTGTAVGTVAVSEPAPLPPAAFPEAELLSYFADGAPAEAMERYRRQEYGAAQTAISKALKTPASAEIRNALLVLQAQVLRDLGQWSQAAELFASGAEATPPIADYLHYEAARAFAKAGSEQATQQASLVDPKGPWGQDMEFLLAEAARANGQPKIAEERYRRFLASTHDAALTTEANFRLGEVLSEQAKKELARQSWRSVLLSDPTSEWATMLRKQDATLDANPSGRELLVRGMAYFVAMRNLESEADFAAALAADSLSAEERCQALFHRAKSLYKERDYKASAPRFVPAIAACKSSGNTNYEVKSAYQAGLAFDRARDYQRSAKYFAYVERFPKHSYADDARLRQAEQYESLNNDTKVRELLEAIPTLYPSGDMRGEAMWRLARRAYMRKDFAEATKWLAEQIRIIPIETNWWAEGQAHYWLGRSLAKLGKRDEAAKAYRDCIRLYPLHVLLAASVCTAQARLARGVPGRGDRGGLAAEPMVGRVTGSRRLSKPRISHGPGAGPVWARRCHAPSTRRDRHGDSRGPQCCDRSQGNRSPGGNQPAPGPGRGLRAFPLARALACHRLSSQLADRRES